MQKMQDELRFFLGAALFQLRQLRLNGNAPQKAFVQRAEGPAFGCEHEAAHRHALLHRQRLLLQGKGIEIAEQLFLQRPGQKLHHIEQQDAPCALCHKARLAAEQRLKQCAAALSKLRAAHRHQPSLRRDAAAAAGVFISKLGKKAFARARRAADEQRQAVGRILHGGLALLNAIVQAGLTAHGFAKIRLFLRAALQRVHQLLHAFEALLRKLAAVFPLGCAPVDEIYRSRHHLHHKPLRRQFIQVLAGKVAANTELVANVLCGVAGHIFSVQPLCGLCNVFQNLVFRAAQISCCHGALHSPFAFYYKSTNFKKQNGKTFSHFPYIFQHWRRKKLRPSAVFRHYPSIQRGTVCPKRHKKRPELSPRPAFESRVGRHQAAFSAKVLFTTSA